MKNLTVLELCNHALLGLNEKPLTSLVTTRTRDAQLLSCLNRAINYINFKGSFGWDEYMGSVIATTGKISYTLTPEGVYNYAPDSRNFSTATLTNVTIAPKDSASFDDTFNMTKCTATGAAPKVLKTTVGTLQSKRVSGSVWLKADTTLAPGTITLEMTDLVGGQSVSTTFTNDGTPQRYGLSGYFSAASTGVKMSISWASETGVVYTDAWQVENNDFPSEYIDNTSVTAEVERTEFADPLRVMQVTPYKYNTQLGFSDIIINDSELYPYDHSLPQVTSSDKWYSLKGYKLNLDNIAAGTHLIYRAKRKPINYTSGTQTLLIPSPEVWILIQGVIALQKSAMYDIGTNQEAGTANRIFADMVEEMLMVSRESPNWYFLQMHTPRMMK